MTARQIEAQRINLIRANEIRSARALLKADLKSGVADPLWVMAEPPGCAVGMSVYVFLRALPLFGKAKAEHVLRGARVSATRPLGSLTERERLTIAARLRRA